MEGNSGRRMDRMVNYITYFLFWNITPIIKKTKPIYIKNKNGIYLNI